MKKKLGIGVLTLLLGIFCAFGLVACGNHSPSGGGSPSSPTEFTKNGLVFDTVEDYYTGEIVTLVTGFKNNSDTVNIPAEVNGHPVVQINRGAFERSKLKQVTIPDSVDYIDAGAFCECKRLKSVTTGNGVKYIGGSAFAGCSSLTEITIPESVTDIGSAAFADCSKLTKITIPESVTDIGSAAFADCSKLTKITISDSVTYIGSGAFYGTGYYNNEANWESDVLYLGEYLLCSTTTLVGTYQIKAGTKLIAESAFKDCIGLTEVTILNGVTTIGWSAFEGCSGLTSITIPDSVTAIGWSAFEGCIGLTEVTIPNGVTSIEGSAFKGCSGLTSVTIPDGVTSIEGSAFYDCSGLTSVTIPNSVTTIRLYAFRNCSGLTSIQFGGTKEEWEAIIKSEDWNTGMPDYTVHCTDGDIVVKK